VVEQELHALDVHPTNIHQQQDAAINMGEKLNSASSTRISNQMLVNLTLFWSMVQQASEQ